MAFVSSALSCNGIQRVEFRPLETTCGLVPRAGSSAAPQHTFESGRTFSLKSSFLGNNSFSFSMEVAINHADAFDFSSIVAEVSTDPSIVIEKLGPDTRNKTWYPKAEDVDKNSKKWYVINAEGQRLGRLATHIATVLRGKNKPTFTPSADTGDYVIVINAEKIAVTGRKELQKTYFRHSGRPGGGKSEILRDLRARIPERILEKAVWGMLPKNSLGREVFRHLKVVAGPDHQYQAQQPEKMEVNTIPKPNSTRITSIW